MQKTIRAATLALGTFALAGFCGGAQAQFVLDNDSGGDGSVLGAYPSFTLTGSNNGVGDNTTFYVESVAPSQSITFTWYYTSNDTDSTAWDTAGFILDGVETQLSVNGPAHLASNGTVVDLLLTQRRYVRLLRALDRFDRRRRHAGHQSELAAAAPAAAHSGARERRADDGRPRGAVRGRAPAPAPGRLTG